jgi:hypothetical protein
MNKQQGNVGNVQVLQSMKAAVAQQRAAGTVPVAWVDSWIAQLESDYGYNYPAAYPYAYSPFRPYSFVDFHPLDTFFTPLFSERVNFRVISSTMK